MCDILQLERYARSPNAGYCRTVKINETKMDKTTTHEKKSWIKQAVMASENKGECEKPRKKNY